MIEKKPPHVSVHEKIYRHSLEGRRERKAKIHGKYRDSFPSYRRITFYNTVRTLPENAPQDMKDENEKASKEKWLALEKGYPHLPAQSNLMIGTKRGEGKVFIGTKGRIKKRPKR